MSGNEDYGSLDEIQKERYHRIMFEYMVAAETVLEYGNVGAIKSEAIAAIRADIERELCKPGVCSWWEERGQYKFSLEFAKIVDALRSGTDT